MIVGIAIPVTEHLIEYLVRAAYSVQCHLGGKASQCEFLQTEPYIVYAVVHIGAAKGGDTSRIVLCSVGCITAPHTHSYLTYTRRSFTKFGYTRGAQIGGILRFCTHVCHVLSG